MKTGGRRPRRVLEHVLLEAGLVHLVSAAEAVLAVDVGQALHLHHHAGPAGCRGLVLDADDAAELVLELTIIPARTWVALMKGMEAPGEGESDSDFKTPPPGRGFGGDTRIRTWDFFREGSTLPLSYIPDRPEYRSWAPEPSPINRRTGPRGGPGQGGPRWPSACRSPTLRPTLGAWDRETPGPSAAPATASGPGTLPEQVKSRPSSGGAWRPPPGGPHPRGGGPRGQHLGPVAVLSGQPGLGHCRPQPGAAGGPGAPWHSWTRCRSRTG